MKLSEKAENDVLAHPKLKMAEVIEFNYLPIKKLIEEIYNLSYEALKPSDKRLEGVSRVVVLKGILERTIRAKNLINHCVNKA